MNESPEPSTKSHPGRSARGSLDIVRALLDRILQILGIHCYRVRVRQLVEFPFPTMPDGYSLRQLTPSEIRRAAQDPTLDLPLEFVDDAIARGDVMTAVTVDGQVVSYAWASAGPAPHVDSVWADVSFPYRYSYKGFTLPAFRGQRLSTLTSFGSDRLFLQRGMTHAVSFTDLSNTPSQRTEHRKGNRFIGFAGYFAFGSRRICFRSAACKRIGFRFIARTTKS